MTQLPLTQLGPDAFKRRRDLVQAEEIKAFLAWYEREFRIVKPLEPKEPVTE